MSPELLALLEPFADLIAEKVAAKQQTAPNECMTVREIARHLRLAPRTVRSLFAAGTLPRVPDLKEFRARRSEVEKYGARKETK